MTQQATPVIGMGATEFSETGKAPYTIVEVVDSETLKVQEDSCIGQWADTEEPLFNPNLEGQIKVVTYRAKWDRWVIKGLKSRDGTGFLLGLRQLQEGY